MTEDGEYELPEPVLMECTCVHDAIAHDWFCCRVENCPCQGHFEE